MHICGETGCKRQCEGCKNIKVNAVSNLVDLGEWYGRLRDLGAAASMTDIMFIVNREKSPPVQIHPVKCERNMIVSKIQDMGRSSDCLVILRVLSRHYVTCDSTAQTLCDTHLFPIHLYSQSAFMQSHKYLVLCQEQTMHTLKLRSRARIKKAKVTNVLDRLPGGVVMHFTPARNRRMMIRKFAVDDQKQLSLSRS